MAVIRRASSLLVALAALAGCGSSPGPEDPAIVAETGIPIGAPGAAGVGFEGPSAAVGAMPEVDPPDEHHPLPLPGAMPPDPFDPMGGHPADAGPPIRRRPPKKKGMQL